MHTLRGCEVHRHFFETNIGETGIKFQSSNPSPRVVVEIEIKRSACKVSRRDSQ
jgi:hypothetical protein